jgi:pimeloyl-ACP methyl ester carboxylesterase
MEGNWSTQGTSTRFSIHSPSARKVASDLNYKCAVASARNHGDSPQHPEFTYESQATDVLALLDKLGKKKAVVLGHSMVILEFLLSSQLGRQNSDELCAKLSRIRI